MGKVEAKKQQVVLAVTQYMVMNGLQDMGIRALAKASGTSDRMLIYYFGTKDALIGAALHAVAATLGQQLDAVLGEHQRSADTLVKELIQLGDVPEFQAVVRLWFEVVGKAVRGTSPYAENAKAIGGNWLQWMESHLIPEDADQALAAFAEVEGNLMLKLLGLGDEKSA